MTLTKEDYAALYDEMMDVNEENVQGEFYVSTLEELKHQAIECKLAHYFRIPFSNYFGRIRK
jgi:hypothetical protein